MDIKFIEMKNEYSALNSFVSNADIETNDNELLRYYMSAVFKIGGSNILYSSDYATLLNTISDQDYTVEQIVTALNCCGEPERKLNIPDFFKSFVEKDVKDGTNYSAEFIEKLNNILVSSAMINGDFTLEEANTLTEIIESLINHAETNGLPVNKKPDNSGKVTAKKLDSYIQSNSTAKTNGSVFDNNQNQRDL